MLEYLEGLPTPEATDVVAEADALAAIKAKFVELATSYGLDVTGIIDLEGEPGNIQLQVDAFREVAIRAAINDAVKANLLAFAACADLDHLAAFYDVIRLVDETDARLRARTVLAISGRSTAGSEDWYKSAAFRRACASGMSQSSTLWLNWRLISQTPWVANPDGISAPVSVSASDFQLFRWLGTRLRQSRLARLSRIPPHISRLQRLRGVARTVMAPARRLDEIVDTLTRRQPGHQRIPEHADPFMERHLQRIEGADVLDDTVAWPVFLQFLDEVPNMRSQMISVPA